MPDEVTPMPVTSVTLKPIHVWAKEVSLEKWKFAALKAGARLDDHSEMTREAFDLAVDKATNFTIRGT